MSRRWLAPQSRDESERERLPDLTPPADESLHDDSHYVGDRPVYGKPRLELQGEDADHDGHEPQEHPARLLLLWAGCLGSAHLLHEPRRTCHYQSKERADYPVGGSKQTQIQSQEEWIDRNGFSYTGEPWVELGRKVGETLRCGCKGRTQGPEEADEDRHLENERPKAADWVDTRLPVELHGLLGTALRIVLVLLVDLLRLRRKLAHGPGHLQLPQGERHHEKARRYGEHDDAQAEVAEEDPVQEYQAVDHRPVDDQVPEVAD